MHVDNKDESDHFPIAITLLKDSDTQGSDTINTTIHLEDEVRYIW